MMGGNVVFVDTNVLIYANVADAPLHSVALSAIVSRYAAGVDIWISRQILLEVVRFTMQILWQPCKFMGLDIY